MDEDHVRTARDFRSAVNMTAGEMQVWLKTEESRSVGWADGEPKSKPGGRESIGHKSGERIIGIRQKAREELTAADYAHMKKVIGYVHRHLAQKPAGDVEHSRWRYSLMNWGHDPMKS